MTRIYNMRPDKVGRNSRIWAAVAIAGCSYEQVAEQEGLSMQRVGQIVKQVEKAIPAEEKDQTRTYRREFLNDLRQKAMEIALMDPAPAFAPNGKPHVDPATGAPVYDYGTRLAAIDRLLKIDERYAKLTGTDNAVDHTLHVSVEAQQATKEQADKISAQFAHLMPESPEVAAYAARH